MTQAITLQQATEFLWQEAEMLDARNYQDWLKLWTEDGMYIIPIEPDAEDYADVLNYAYDDAKMREMRIIRLESSHSMSALTAATTIRTVSRLVVKHVSESEISLCAAQHLAEYRRDNTRLLPANVEVTLRQTDDGIKLARKVVKLANCEDAVAGMAFLL